MSNITKTHSRQCEGETAPQLFDDWFDPIESAVRERAREFIEELIRGELDAALARPRYECSKKPAMRQRRALRGSRTRSLTGSFGPIEIAVPRARLETPEDRTTEWKSQALRRSSDNAVTHTCLGRGTSNLKARIGVCPAGIGGIIDPVQYETCKKVIATSTKARNPTAPSVADDPRWARIVAREPSIAQHGGRAALLVGLLDDGIILKLPPPTSATRSALI
jgi:hypothetical protein